MYFTFTEVITDEILDELVREIGFVYVQVAQYKIDSDLSLETYDFQNEADYKLFFTQFADYANERWKLATGSDWDFGKFPFRESSETIMGLFRILKTGGPHTEDTGAPYSEDEATKIEEKYRESLQKDSQSLIVFCYVKDDLRGEDVSGGFGIPNEILEVGKISSFFHGIAWDDLIFIINPKHNTLYVIAYTGTD